VKITWQHTTTWQQIFPHAAFEPPKDALLSGAYMIAERMVVGQRSKFARSLSCAQIMT